MDHPLHLGVYKVGCGSIIIAGGTNRASYANVFQPFTSHKTCHIEFTEKNREVEVRAHARLEQYRIYKQGRATEWFRAPLEIVIRAVEESL